jgi:hypothetical protein
LGHNLTASWWKNRAKHLSDLISPAASLSLWDRPVSGLRIHLYLQLEIEKCKAGSDGLRPSDARRKSHQEKRQLSVTARGPSRKHRQT